MEIKKYKLTDICDFQGGSQPPKKEWSKSKKEGYIRMLQIRDFTQSHRDNVEYVKVSKRLKTCKSDDVLIGRYGASIGKILTGLEGAYNVAIMKTIPNEEIISKKYLLALLKAPLFQHFILSVGVRAAQAGFNKDDLSKFHVYLPSLVNQKRIAKILDTCEKLVLKRKESIELLEEFLKSTFLEMFGDSSKFKIMSVNDIASKDRYALSSGPFGSNLTSKHYTSSGVTILRGKNISSGKLDLSDIKYVSESKAYELRRSAIKPNDIVIVAVGSSGSALRIPEILPHAIMSQNFNKITPNEKLILPIYLEFSINSEIVQRQFRKVMSDGGRTFLSLTKIKEINIPIPNKNEQLKFEQIVLKIELVKEQFQNSLVEIENLYGSLSQKAFKGELDLSKVVISQFDELNIPETNFEDLSNEVSAEPATIEKLEQIIKSRFGYQEFSIPQIEEILSKQGIDYTTSLVKGFIKDLLSEEKIRTEYSGSTHQVIFKYNK